jgi:D-alanine-D-alanine ligase
VRVTVLTGGTSDERDVSLASGVQVAAALRAAGHEVVALDTAVGVLTADDEAALLSAGVGTVPPLERQSSIGLIDLARHEEVLAADVVFPALHGGQGEDGTLQGILEAVGVVCCGSDMLGCALAMDKDVSKRLMRDAGIATPDWVTAPPGEGGMRGQLQLPVVVKPVSGGSSVHLTLAEDYDRVAEALSAVAFTGLHMMMETLVRGREFTVGVLGDQTFPVGEIITEHEFFDYECKYQAGMAEEVFPAQNLPDALATELQELALRTHRLLRLRDFSRVDFIVDEEGRPWCLEANALPGMTAASLLPKAARAGGLDFPVFCDRVVQMAADRRH